MRCAPRSGVEAFAGGWFVGCRFEEIKMARIESGCGMVVVLVLLSSV
jgi:hypothetical protein